MQCCCSSDGLTNKTHICWPCQRIAEMWKMSKEIHPTNVFLIQENNHLAYCYSRRFQAKAKHKYQ